MTAHQHARVVIAGRFTQDGYDWPTPHPEPPQPMAPYFRAQLIEDGEATGSALGELVQPLVPSGTATHP